MSVLVGGVGSSFTATTRPRDTDLPSAVLSSSVGSALGRLSPIPLSLTFSKTISGLELSDFNVVNGSVSSLAGSGLNWTLSLVPSQGTVTVVLQENGVSDRDGNGNRHLIY